MCGARALYNRWHDGDESLRGFKRLQHRSMHTSEVLIDRNTMQIKMSNDQVIRIA